MPDFPDALILFASAAERPGDWTDSVPPFVLWLWVGLMLLGVVAVTVWVFRATFRSGKEVYKAVAATPKEALSRLGLRVDRADPAGGQASGIWAGVPVRVSWELYAPGGGPDFDSPHTSTFVKAQIHPPLRTGMHALETHGEAMFGDPRLDGRLLLRAQDHATARARILHAAAPIAASLGSGGQLSITDDTASLMAPSVLDQDVELRRRLDAVTAIARAFSG